MTAIIRKKLSRRTRNSASQTDEKHEARNEVELNRWNRNQRYRNVAFNPYRGAFN